MSFLGLVGIPATPLTYPAYQALKALSPALGAAFAGAEAAAIAGIAAQGAAVLGAGALGWMIGTAIREQLLPGEPPLELSTWVNGGVPGEQVSVEFTFYTPPNAPISTNVIVTAPFAGVLRKVRTADDDVFFLRQVSPPLDVFMAQFNRAAQPGARIEITALKKLDGTPAENLRKVPVLPQKPTYAPVTVPTTIPATPQYPAIPITPTVVPTPGNDPDEDDKVVTPGVTVKIPELGLQIRYGPAGVSIGRYKDPFTAPFDAPKITLPPGLPKLAIEPCPCPPIEPPDNDELLCRIKTLQDEILNAGFTLQIRTKGSAQCVTDGGFDADFRFLEVTATTIPANAKRISYPAPGVDTVFVGNMQFVINGSLTEPVPIRGQNQITVVPPEATGYVVSGAFGFQVFARAYLYTKLPYIDLC